MITHPVLSRHALFGVKLGLERVEDFLAWIGDPHRAMPVIQVAGTNGKGSVVEMVTQALRAAGLRVGTNTSPHLEHVNERIRIDGEPLSDAELDQALRSIDDARRAWIADRGHDDDALTYFELVTTLAFERFAHHNVDVAVVEVGLGGRLDATSAADPVVAAVVSVGLDHMAQLGPDLASIAREKAAILPPSGRSVCGALAPEALAVVAQVAHEHKTSLWGVGAELTVSPASDGWRIRTPDGELDVPALAMPGSHQVHNAAVAVGLLHQLRALGWRIEDAAIAKGVSEAVVPGRLERLGPGLVADGAHNAAAAQALARWLRDHPCDGTRVLLWGMGSDRDPQAVIAPLLDVVDRVITTRCAHPKARDPESLAALLGGASVPVRAGHEIERSLPDALDQADQVVVAGSLYLVGAARAVSRSDAVVARLQARSQDA